MAVTGLEVVLVLDGASTAKLSVERRKIEVGIIAALDDVDFSRSRPGARSQSPPGRPSPAYTTGHIVEIGNKQTILPCLFGRNSYTVPSDIRGDRVVIREVTVVGVVIKDLSIFTSGVRVSVNFLGSTNDREHPITVGIHLVSVINKAICGVGAGEELPSAEKAPGLRGAVLGVEGVG